MTTKQKLMQLAEMARSAAEGFFDEEIEAGGVYPGLGEEVADMREFVSEIETDLRAIAERK